MFMFTYVYCLYSSSVANRYIYKSLTSFKNYVKLLTVVSKYYLEILFRNSFRQEETKN